LSEEDPPVATLTWRRPVYIRGGGELLGYRLTYGSLAADFVVTDQRLLQPDKHRFITGFLGQSEQPLLVHTTRLRRGSPRVLESP